jgi:tRNA uridine 5-carboxymethylaminomethyl modification enzyme
MQAALLEIENLAICEDAAEDLVPRKGPRYRRRHRSGAIYRAATVVLTTGTFLGGLIHIGEQKIPAGRVGEAPSMGLSQTLRGFGLQLGRLKTGTPPRLDGQTIDWSGLAVQHGDDPPTPFSFLTAPHRNGPNPLSHHGDHGRHARDHPGEPAPGADVFGPDRERRPALLPLHRGQGGALRRREAHQIFLEPEGLDDDTIYPNGISTSLPKRFSATS